LHILKANTTLYPDPFQAIYRGSKLTTLMSLAEIAKNVTRTFYPKVLTIANIENEDILNNTNLVFKRGYSDASGLVFTGGTKSLGDVKQLVEQQNQYYGHPSLPEIGVVPRWFAVPWIYDILNKGEIRCYFIGGLLRYKVKTSPKSVENMRVVEVHELTPLANLM
jgi:hypothetical protein